MDINALQVRMLQCTQSVTVVDETARGRTFIDQPLQLLMVTSLNLFVELAADFHIEVAAGDRVDDFIEVVGDAVAQPGSTQHSLAELYKRFRGITRAYLIEVRKAIAHQRKVEATARKAARKQAKVAAKLKHRK